MPVWKTTGRSLGTGIGFLRSPIGEGVVVAAGRRAGSSGPPEFPAHSGVNEIPQGRKTVTKIPAGGSHFRSWTELWRLARLHVSGFLKGWGPRWASGRERS